jgi:transposase
MARPKSLVNDNFFNEIDIALSEIKDNEIVLKLLSLKALKDNSYEEISRIFDVSRISLTNWVKSFKKSGVEGLMKKPKKPKPSKLTDDQLKIIEGWLIEGKNNSGKFVNWTIEKLKKEIFEVFAVEVGKTPLWIRMRKMNFVLKSPRPEHHKSDKNLQTDFKKN